MNQLQDGYGDKTQKDIYVRRNMKKKLVEIFGNKLIFITVRPDTHDVVINSEAIESTLNMSDKETSIKSYLREDIQEYCTSLPLLSWPPTVEELCTENRLPPASITLFLTNLLRLKHDVQTVKVNRLVDSYSTDFILLTLVHSISYGKTCEIELAQAQKAQELAKQSSMLPLKPKPTTENDFVLTVFFTRCFHSIIFKHFLLCEPILS